MARTIFLYALALGLSAIFLQWLQYRYLARAFSSEIYLGLLAMGFIALGIWVGQRLTSRRAPAQFRRNEEAIHSLRLTARECEILALLASGQSNKEMARQLSI